MLSQCLTGSGGLTGLAISVLTGKPFSVSFLTAFFRSSEFLNEGVVGFLPVFSGAFYKLFGLLFLPLFFYLHVHFPSQIIL